MPGMNGYEAAEIPIIFVTANSAEDEQLFRGYDAGAVGNPVEPGRADGTL